MRKTLGLICIGLILPGIVSAKEISFSNINNSKVYVNENNVIMNEHQVNELRTYIVECIYNDENGNVIDVETNEITKTEYEGPKSLLKNSCKNSINSIIPDTVYARKTTIQYSYSDLENHYGRVVVDNVWSTIPKIKEFDVIGVMWPADKFVVANIKGLQIYDGSTITYEYGGKNTVYRTTGNYHGAAVAQNIVNSTSKSLENKILVDGTVNTGAQFFGSYQHAHTNLATTLVDAQNFTFDINGYGNVFNFMKLSAPKYDNAPGVKTKIVYS